MAVRRFCIVPRLGVFMVAALGALTACTSAPPPSRGPVVIRDTPRTEAPLPEDRAEPLGERRRYDERGFVEPLHMRGNEPVRVGLLLPFSASSPAAQRIASAMFDAAQLAAFEAGDETFLLIPKDTRGTPEGAASAARAALADGAEMLLGPLFSESVDAVAPVARAAQTPVIAFSSDSQSGGDGVYLLSFPPEIEIARVTEYAVSTGIERFGVLAPANDYGERVSASFNNQVAGLGGIIVHEERYEQDPDAMLAPAKRLAQYAREVVPVELRHDYDPNQTYTDAADQGLLRGYQAVLMPEQGTLLRALAPLLPYYNVDITAVKLLGVSAWNNPALTREPALRGGWFAAPDPDVADAFKARYEKAFGERPPRLASLSYDGALLAARLAQSRGPRGRFSTDDITNRNGYFGADGLFRLNEDGSIERGLAILEIQPGGIQVVDPAPPAFAIGF